MTDPSPSPSRGPSQGPSSGPPALPSEGGAATVGLTYRDAGVDIDAGAELVRRIGPHVARTRTPGVLGGIGGFGGLFALPVERYREPVLVSGADGVGTKLKLAIELGRHDGIGVDLVAMCANDILVPGAEPLFFLDYYACAALDVDVAERVVAGIAAGCELAGMALLGGETAEMPGLYARGDYDLAGFAVGVVERAEIVDGSAVRTGDAVLGLASSGVHSNGYSLVRRVLERAGPGALDAPLPDGEADETLGEALLAPTRIYVRAVRELMRSVPVRAMAHVTGGGLVENLPRMLPDGLAVALDLSGVRRPPVFDWIARTGGVAEAEMRRTFNCGVGFALVVAPADADAAIRALADAGERAVRIGEIVDPGDGPDAAPGGGTGDGAGGDESG